MDNRMFVRLQIAGLYLVSFMGLVMHVLMATFENVVSLLKAVVSMNTEGATVNADIIRQMGETAQSFGASSISVMMFVCIAVSLFTVLIPLVSNAKGLRWVTVVVGALLVVMNSMDGAVHIFKEGEVINGLYTLLISGGVGIVATVIAFTWARNRDA